MHAVLGLLLQSIGFIAMWTGYALLGFVLLAVSTVYFPKHAGRTEAPVSYALIRQMVSRRRLFFLNLCLIGGGFSTVEAML